MKIVIKSINRNIIYLFINMFCFKIYEYDLMTLPLGFCGNFKRVSILETKLFLKIESFVFIYKLKLRALWSPIFDLGL